MSVSMVLKLAFCLTISIFISACSHSNNGKNNQTPASNLTAVNGSHLTKPATACEQLYSPALSDDPASYGQLSKQIQLWTSNIKLNSGLQLTAIPVQLPRRHGDHIRARLFVDQVAIWPTTILLSNASGEIATADPALMEKVVTGNFDSFQADEKQVIEQARATLDPSSHWMDSCRIYDIGSNAADIQAAWLVSFQQGFGGHGIEISDSSLHVIRTWPLAQD